MKLESVLLLLLLLLVGEVKYKEMVHYFKGREESGKQLIIKLSLTVICVVKQEKLSKGERRERKTVTKKLSSTIMCVVKREKLSSTIMENLNKLKVNDSR